MEAKNETQTCGSQEESGPRLVRSNSMSQEKPFMCHDPDGPVKSDSDDRRSEEILSSKPFITEVHQQWMKT